MSLWHGQRSSRCLRSASTCGNHRNTKWSAFGKHHFPAPGSYRSPNSAGWTLAYFEPYSIPEFVVASSIFEEKTLPSSHCIFTMTVPHLCAPLDSWTKAGRAPHTLLSLKAALTGVLWGKAGLTVTDYSTSDEVDINSLKHLCVNIDRQILRALHC